jgi:hypothetical protein
MSNEEGGSSSSMTTSNTNTTTGGPVTRNTSIGAVLDFGFSSSNNSNSREVVNSSSAAAAAAAVTGGGGGVGGYSPLNRQVPLWIRPQGDYDHNLDVGGHLYNESGEDLFSRSTLGSASSLAAVDLESSLQSTLNLVHSSSPMGIPSSVPSIKTIRGGSGTRTKNKNSNTGATTTVNSASSSTTKNEATAPVASVLSSPSTNNASFRHLHHPHLQHPHDDLLSWRTGTTISGGIGGGSVGRGGTQSTSATAGRKIFLSSSSSSSSLSLTSPDGQLMSSGGVQNGIIISSSSPSAPSFSSASNSKMQYEVTNPSTSSSSSSPFTGSTRLIQNQLSSSSLSTAPASSSSSSSHRHVNHHVRPGAGSIQITVGSFGSSSSYSSTITPARGGGMVGAINISGSGGGGGSDEYFSSPLTSGSSSSIIAPQKAVASSSTSSTLNGGATLSTTFVEGGGGVAGVTRGLSPIHFQHHQSHGEASTLGSSSMQHSGMQQYPTSLSSATSSATPLRPTTLPHSSPEGGSQLRIKISGGGGGGSLSSSAVIHPSALSSPPSSGNGNNGSVVAVGGGVVSQQHQPLSSPTPNFPSDCRFVPIASSPFSVGAQSQSMGGAETNTTCSSPLARTTGMTPFVSDLSVSGSGLGSTYVMPLPLPSLSSSSSSPSGVGVGGVLISPSVSISENIRKAVNAVRGGLQTTSSTGLGTKRVRDDNDSLTSTSISPLRLPTTTTATTLSGGVGQSSTSPAAILTSTPILSSSSSLFDLEVPSFLTPPHPQKDVAGGRVQNSSSSSSSFSSSSSSSSSGAGAIPIPLLPVSLPDETTILRTSVVSATVNAPLRPRPQSLVPESSTRVAKTGGGGSEGGRQRR